MSERSVFLSALEFDDPAARRAYLDQTCGAAPDLRRRVDALLAAHADSQSFLDRPAAEQAPPDLTAPHAAAGPAAAAPGTLLADRYRLGDELGRGGMGTVYRAEQVAPVRRPVAVKLVNPGMDSRVVLLRFEAERQALAVMDHPHIAKVLDAGATPDGRPFFVMELVNGVPLTDYCDARRLPVADRLALFRLVCGAVQHAHQKGVIHRDLKPTNILVEDHAGAAVPKVIDFGLAKAVGGAPLTEQTLLTAPGAVAGTPLYMAPEQAGPDARDVDTRADVYALGAVLYELLTGGPPIGRETLRKAVLHEILRVIREDDPPPPSSRLGSSDALPSVAANRGTEPARLGRFVRGDLDWVAMKALDKDRGRRYESAAALAADVERFLNHEPVAAGPPSRRYRAGKFVRRNRAVVTAAGLVLLAVVTGAGVAGWQAVRATVAERATAAQLVKTLEAEGRATAERDAAREAEARAVERERREAAARAEADRQKGIADAQTKRAEGEATAATAAKQFLESVLIQSRAEGQATRERTANPNLTLRETLDHAAKTIAGKFDGQPVIEADLRSVIALSYLGLDELRAAELHLTAALRLREGALGATHPDTLKSMTNLGGLYRERGDFAAAEPLLRRAATGFETVHGPDHPYTLVAVSNLAGLLDKIGDAAAAERLYRRVLAGEEKVHGPEHDSTLTTLNNLALLLLRRGGRTEAESLLRRAVTDSEAALGPDDPTALLSAHNLGRLLQEADEYAAAEPFLRRAAAGRERTLGPTHSRTLQSLVALAAVNWSMGRLDQSVPLFEDALRRRTAALGAGHVDTIHTLANLGVNNRDAGRAAEAVPMLERAYQERARHPKLGFVGAELLIAYARAGRRTDATRLAGELLAEGRRASRPGSPELGRLLAVTGDTLLGLDPAAAEPVLRECVAVREKLAPAAWNTANAKSLLGDALCRQKKYAAAEPLLLAGYAGLLADANGIPPGGKTNLPAAANRLVRLYLVLGKPDEVARWRAERAKYPPELAPMPRAKK